MSDVGTGASEDLKVAPAECEALGAAAARFAAAAGGVRAAAEVWTRLLDSV